MIRPSRLKADLLLLFVAFIWGTAFITQTYAGKAGLAFLFNGVCFLVASLVLLPLVRARNIPAAQWKWMLAGGVILFGGSACQQYGMYFTKVANAGFLTTLNVIFTPLLLWLGFRERPRAAEIFAVALAVAGAFLLSTGGTIEWQVGDLFEILGALFWAMHLVLVAKWASRFEAISYASGQFFVCAVLNFAVGIFIENPAQLLLGPVLLATAYRAVLSIGVGYTLQVWLQKFTPPTDAALIFSLEAVFAAVAGWILLSETLAPVQLLGCALILSGAVVPQFGKTHVPVSES